MTVTGIAPPSKAAWKSLGFWGSAVSAILPILQVAGIVPPGLEIALGQIASGLVALYGRWRARSPLSVT